MASLRLRASLLAVVFAGGFVSALAESGNAPPTAALTSAQIVDAMQKHNQARSGELKHYKAVRSYEVGYKGLVNLGAKMEVEVSFDAASGKSFRIVSQSGSKLLIDKVLKRLVETEKEADGNLTSTALTQANYSFKMLGTESVAGRPTYILSVEPLKESKLLYRGKVWVDAADFAVVKIDVEPSKNPSFWIAKTEIRHSYAKTGDFWLPERNRSESKVRIGGTAVLTIDYGTYKIDNDQARQASGN